MQIKSKIRRPLFLSLVFVIATSAVALPFGAVYRWIYEGDALLIRNFVVRETAHIKSSEVNEYLRAFLGKPLYGIDLNRMADRLAEHPYVASASIRRSPPYSIEIDPVERIPIASVFAGKWLLVDDRGVAYRIVSAADAKKFPIIQLCSLAEIRHCERSEAIHALCIQGKPGLLHSVRNDGSLQPSADLGLPKKNVEHLKIAAEAINTYNFSSKSLGEITSLQFDANDSLSVIFKDGPNVEIGHDDYATKWQNLDSLTDIFKDNSKQVSYIYLGKYPNSGQVALKFK